MGHETGPFLQEETEVTERAFPIADFRLPIAELGTGNRIPHATAAKVAKKKGNPRMGEDGHGPRGNFLTG